jgi:hypothetical protein
MSGSGSYVTISEDKVSPVYTSTWYDREYARNLTETMQSDLAKVISDLGGIVETFNPPQVDADVDLTDVEGPSFPLPIDLDDLKLNTNWPEDYPIMDNLMDYGDLDFSFLEPIPPEEVDGSFDWQASEYTSDLWEALFTKVYNGLITGGTGLTTEVHSAILERGKEARRQNQEREYSRALNAVGARGFDLPSGAVAGMQLAVFKEYSKLDQDELNLVIIKDFDLAIEMTKFFITSAISMEQMLRDAFNNAENRSLEAVKAAKDFILKVYSENVRLYLAKWEGIKLKFEAIKTKVDAISSYNDGAITVFEKGWDAIKTQTEAIASENKSKIDVQSAELANQQIKVDTVAKEWAVIINKAQLEIQQVTLEIDALFREAGLELDAISKQSDLATQIAEAIGKMVVQVMASALGTVNTSVSDSHSINEGLSESWAHGESLSESHAYEDA